jgi:peptidoglycan/LPS O-acetylase OafA/YrhL
MISSNQMQVAIPSSNHRDAELDGLRGLAVGMVLAWHFIGIPAWASEGWAFQALFRVFLMGGAGVNLFFVLSGFLITRIIISRKNSNKRFLLAFYARRALRILPPYLLLVAIFGVIVWISDVHNNVFNDKISLWRFLTFTQNFWMAENASYGPDAISVTWSVAIEEQYYLVFPVLALMLPKLRLPVFLACIAVTSVVWRACIFALDPSNNFPSDLGTLARLDGLAIGGLIACAFNNPQWKKWLRTNLVGLRRAMLWSFVMLLFVRRDSGSLMAYIGHTTLNLCSALVITNILLRLGSTSLWMHALRSRGLLFLGRISYSLYLFHPIIIATAFLLTGYPKTLSGLPQVFLLIGSLMLSLFFCHLLFVRLEKKLIDFGRKMPY